MTAHSLRLSASQNTYRRPYVGHLRPVRAFRPAVVCLPAVPLTLAAVWAVLGTVALVARARDRR